MKPLHRLALVLAPQVLILCGLVARAEWTSRTGTEVELAVRPYDPMDLFAGRYIRSSLVIEELEEERLQLLAPLPGEGATVYVRLVPGAPYWNADAIANHRPAGDPAVFLRGKLVRRADGALRVDYGLGRYYIPETFPDPSFANDESGRRVAISLVVSVDAGGTPVTKDLLVDGRPLAEWARTAGQL